VIVWLETVPFATLLHAYVFLLNQTVFDALCAPDVHAYNVDEIWCGSYYLMLFNTTWLVFVH
jgi:hypothetical protein